MTVEALNVVVLFECSGAVADAFASLGHNTLSVDLKPREPVEALLHPTRFVAPHRVADVYAFLSSPEFAAADLVIAHPCCRYMAASGLHWNNRVPGRAEKTADAVEKYSLLLDAVKGKRFAIENPPGRATALFGFQQSIYFCDFGADNSKHVCLRMDGLLPLRSTVRRAGRLVEWPRGSGVIVERWSNQTDSGQDRRSPGPNREADRSRFDRRVGAAMALQWGGVVSGFEVIGGAK